jgi:hypothetical protein
LGSVACEKLTVELRTSATRAVQVRSKVDFIKEFCLV